MFLGMPQSGAMVVGAAILILFITTLTLARKIGARVRDGERGTVQIDGIAGRETIVSARIPLPAKARIA